MALVNVGDICSLAHTDIALSNRARFSNGSKVFTIKAAEFCNCTAMKFMSLSVWIPVVFLSFYWFPELKTSQGSSLQFHCPI
jgi:hypothetical protein